MTSSTERNHFCAISELLRSPIAVAIPSPHAFLDGGQRLRFQARRVTLDSYRIPAHEFGATQKSARLRNRPSTDAWVMWNTNHPRG
jgi:hypothetical protein